MRPAAKAEKPKNQGIDGMGASGVIRRAQARVLTTQSPQASCLKRTVRQEAFIESIEHVEKRSVGDAAVRDPAWATGRMSREAADAVGSALGGFGNEWSRRNPE